MSTRLYIQTQGPKVAVLIEDQDREKLESVFFSFFNWGCSLSNDLFETGNPNSCYFWTTRRRLFHYFENIIEHRFFLKYGYEPCDRCRSLINKMAQDRMNKLELRSFLPRNTRSYLEIEVCHSMY